MTINSQSHHPDRMISASTPAAGRSELHTVVTQDGMAKMREVNVIDIPAKSVTKFLPNGFHIMFLQLPQPFKEGATVPVTLKFEKSGEITVDFVVKPITYSPSGQTEPMSHNHGGMK
jgi:copper(I)-binding protein